MARQVYSSRRHPIKFHPCRSPQNLDPGLSCTLQALTAKAEDEEVPIAEQLREPKLAEQMLELQARSLLLRHHRRRS